jgi:putative ABC transport system ATP-binding protein
LNVITAKNLGHVYQRPVIKDLSGERRISALSSVTFNLQENTISVFIGPSGSGKSTLFNILASYLVPTVGLIKINDVETFTLDANSLQSLRWEQIGYLKQKLEKNFINEISFDDNLRLLFFNKKELSKVYEELSYYIDKLNLQPRHLKVPIQLLSGGEKQRLALLKLIIRDPELFILDEPSSFLDEENKQRVLLLIEELKRKGKTIVIASHDEDYINIADNLHILQDGKIISQGNIPLMSEILTDTLMINGEKPTKEFLIEIPKIIFQNLSFNTIYILKEISTSSSILQLVATTREDFDNKKHDTWIYLDKQNFIIPKKFQNMPWFESEILWQIKDGVVVLELQKHEKEGK